LWIVEVSSKFTEIATEGFTHPEHVMEMGMDSKWIAYTKG
jgi:hypothetical protein